MENKHFQSKFPKRQKFIEFFTKTFPEHAKFAEIIYDNDESLYSTEQALEMLDLFEKKFPQAYAVYKNTITICKKKGATDQTLFMYYIQHLCIDIAN
jgi:hypothetical protein